MLSYLFTATYADGFRFEQNEDDISKLFEGKSSFTDALHYEKEHGKIVTFILVGPGGTIGVDLETGRFGANGAEVVLGGEQPPQGCELRLIFYREHMHKRIFGEQTGKFIEETHTIRYCLGWQTTVDGRNMQQIMGIF